MDVAVNITVTNQTLTPRATLTSAMTASRQILNETDALRLVVEGTVAETGAEFFRVQVAFVNSKPALPVFGPVPCDNALRRSLRGRDSGQIISGIGRGDVWPHSRLDWSWGFLKW
jgi:hypothetical protein